MLQIKPQETRQFVMSKRKLLKDIKREVRSGSEENRRRALCEFYEKYNCLGDRGHTSAIL